MNWVSKWIVSSHSSNREYTVSLAEDGETWGCSCPHWKFRRAECKHIREVKAETENVTKIDFFDEMEFAV